MGTGESTRRWAPISMFMSMALGGCGAGDAARPGAGFGIFSAWSLAPDPAEPETEDNDSFAAASALTLESGREARSGNITSAADADLFEIGSIHPGDRITLEVQADGRLDPVAAVFDADANALYVNDDRNYFAGQVDPYLGFVVRRYSPRCYVAVASSPGSNTAGSYTLSVARDAEAGEPELAPQSVLLNFDGAADVAFGGRPAVDVAYFDAADISDSLAGRTDALIAAVLQRIREDYQGIDVEFYSSREHVPTDGAFSTIHFGGYDRRLLGVAENVDEFNSRPIQEALVFTDTFAVFNPLAPTLEEYAQALANVASHEIGHLLGLVHTADPEGLMDVTAGLRELMLNQTLARSPVESSVFPLGYQDAPAMLVDSLGGDLAVVRAGIRVQRQQPPGRAFEEMGIYQAAQRRPRLSVCFCDACRAARVKKAARAECGRPE